MLKEVYLNTSLSWIHVTLTWFILDQSFRWLTWTNMWVCALCSFVDFASQSSIMHTLISNTRLGSWLHSTLSLKSWSGSPERVNCWLSPFVDFPPHRGFNENGHMSTCFSHPLSKVHCYFNIKYTPHAFSFSIYLFYFIFLINNIIKLFYY